jgi:hypothetical protein
MHEGLRLINPPLELGAAAFHALQQPLQRFSARCIRVAWLPSVTCAVLSKKKQLRAHERETF